MVTRERRASSIGGLLRRARQFRKLSQRELADRLGTTQSVISRIEAGHSIPTVGFLRRVAAALDATLVVGLLFDGEFDGAGDGRVFELWPPHGSHL